MRLSLKCGWGHETAECRLDTARKANEPGLAAWRADQLDTERQTVWVATSRAGKRGQAGDIGKAGEQRLACGRAPGMRERDLRRGGEDEHPIGAQRVGQRSLRSGQQVPVERHTERRIDDDAQLL